MAHGIDYSTYAHLAQLEQPARQPVQVAASDAVVVDLPVGTHDITRHFEAMKVLFPKSLMVWFVSTLGFELPQSLPAHWSVLEKPSQIGALEHILHLDGHVDI